MRFGRNTTASDPFLDGNGDRAISRPFAPRSRRQKAPPSRPLPPDEIWTRLDNLAFNPSDPETLLKSITFTSYIHSINTMGSAELNGRDRVHIVINSLHPFPVRGSISRKEGVSCPRKPRSLSERLPKFM